MLREFTFDMPYIPYITQNTPKTFYIKLLQPFRDYATNSTRQQLSSSKYQKLMVGPSLDDKNDYVLKWRLLAAQVSGNRSIKFNVIDIFHLYLSNDIVNIAKLKADMKMTFNWYPEIHPLFDKGVMIRCGICTSKIPITPLTPPAKEPFCFEKETELEVEEKSSCVPVLFHNSVGKLFYFSSCLLTISPFFQLLSDKDCPIICLNRYLKRPSNLL